jgi:hypothetical protein
MVIVKLKGRLGNQMFQYAVGRSLSARLGTQLTLDSSWLDEMRAKGLSIAYELDVFRIDVPVRPVWGAARLANPSRLVHALQLLRPSRRRFVSTIAEGASYAFEPEVLTTPDDVYLDGYWQSERYFAEHEELIRSDFAFPALSAESERVAEEIRRGRTVSVHVRRGDYAVSARLRTTHGLLGSSYYERAVEKIAATAENVRLFVFSDDPSWCRTNLAFRQPTTIVERPLPGDRAWEDMRLLSLCEHHVVGNSSFSWWGAWLDPSPAKVVVAPVPWLLAGDDGDEARVPSTWIRIPRDDAYQADQPPSATSVAPVT